MSSSAARTGRCLCGAVRIEVAGEPRTVRTCWCRVCQYLGAGSATVNVIFASADVSVRGELVSYVSVADSGNVMQRRFCPVCGTSVLSASDARPDVVVVRAGVLDERDGLRPEMVIWTRGSARVGVFRSRRASGGAQPGPVR